MPETPLILEGYTAVQCFSEKDIPSSCYAEDVHLIFLLEGAITISCGREQVDLYANQMALLKRNIWVEYNMIGRDEGVLRYLQFTIKPSLVREFARWMELQAYNLQIRPMITALPAGSAWMSYAHSLEPFLHGIRTPQPGFIKIKMLELLFHLSETEHQLLAQVLDLRPSSLTNITETVEENIMNTLSIEQLATLSGRSLSSFRRDFIAIYNMTPSQWIKSKRLEKAREMLRGTTMSVTEICYTTGFSHVAHFSRIFKSHFGFPPSNCRAH